MSQASAIPERKLGYSRARLSLLGVGLLVLLLIAALMLARSVDRVEVLGILLFIPVFIAALFWNVSGGVIAAVLAAAAYGFLRYPAIQSVGLEPFIGTISARTIGYLLFGFLGGWANKQLETSLTKLELYDQIDDATGLFNARFFLQDTDLETSRSQRYQTIFSVAVVDVPAEILAPLSRRQRTGLLKELGRILHDSVRTVDRAVHGTGPNSQKLAVVLPETGKQGASIFAERLGDRLTAYLKQRGVAVSKPLIAQAHTFPEDEAGISALREEFAEIDRLEHPEESESSAEPSRAED